MQVFSFFIVVYILVRPKEDWTFIKVYLLSPVLCPSPLFFMFFFFSHLQGRSLSNALQIAIRTSTTTTTHPFLFFIPSPVKFHCMLSSPFVGLENPELRQKGQSFRLDSVVAVADVGLLSRERWKRKGEGRLRRGELWWPVMQRLGYVTADILLWGRWIAEEFCWVADCVTCQSKAQQAIIVTTPFTVWATYILCYPTRNRGDSGLVIHTPHPHHTSSS